MGFAIKQYEYIYIYTHTHTHTHTYPHPLELPSPPHPTLLGHNRAKTELPVLNINFPSIFFLSILHIVIYIFQCYSFNLPNPLLPMLCPQVLSLRLHLYSCPANKFISMD